MGTTVRKIIPMPVNMSVGDQAAGNGTGKLNNESNFSPAAHANQTLPDVRPSACRGRTFPKDLPTVTIVIPCLHETLLQIKATAASLLANTPVDLIDEVRFVNDVNPEDHIFKATLEALHPKIKVMTDKMRMGLASKVFGADNATSPVLIFLEPHLAFSPEWLEPLLERMVNTSKKNVVMPVTNFKSPLSGNMTSAGLYAPANVSVGAFTFENMTFRWRLVSRRNASHQVSDPFPTPAMSGSIFAVWREWWLESGTYDVGMDESGGESLEMSLRIWTCGGSIETMGCSHIYDLSRAESPSVHVAAKNTKRTVSVWLDEYSDLYFQANPYMRSVDAGNVSDRVALRTNLQCEPFQWYLDNVYPEMKQELEAIKLRFPELTNGET